MAALVAVAVWAVPTLPATAAEVAAEGTVESGIYSEDFFAAADLDALASAAGGRVTFAGTFHDVTENQGVQTRTWSNTRELLAEVWRGKATPFANVVVKASAASIASGAHDAEIAEWVSHVQQYLDLPEFADGPAPNVIVAPLQEANGSWTAYGCDPGNFKVAFRKFVDEFRRRGIDETQVRFAFAPNGWTSPGCGKLADYYPGDAYVDVLAFSGYNFGTCVGNAWDPVSWVMSGPIAELRAIDPTKPIIVAQTAAPRWASCGGDQAQWVRDLFAFLAADRQVAAFVWCNHDKETDWRVWDGQTVSPGWKDATTQATTTYRWPLTDWFGSGPLRVAPAAPIPGTCPDGRTCDGIGLVDAGGRWTVRSGLGSADPVASFYFGDPGDVPMMGDWDCDGVATPGLYRQSDGYVYLRNSNTQGVADVKFFFGDPGDVPLAGDFDGDGCDTVSIFRPSEGRVFVINELGANDGGLGAAEFDFFFGNPGDVPFVGDFDGDGVDSVGLYRRSTGFVYFRDALSSGVADREFFYGDPGDVIVAGDWDGDGDDTVAVYRPSTGSVYVNFDNAPGIADYTLYVGGYATVLAP